MCSTLKNKDKHATSSLLEQSQLLGASRYVLLRFEFIVLHEDWNRTKSSAAQIMHSFGETPTLFDVFY